MIKLILKTYDIVEYRQQELLLNVDQDIRHLTFSINRVREKRIGMLYSDMLLALDQWNKGPRPVTGSTNSVIIEHLGVEYDSKSVYVYGSSTSSHIILQDGTIKSIDDCKFKMIGYGYPDYITRLFSDEYVRLKQYGIDEIKVIIE